MGRGAAWVVVAVLLAVAPAAAGPTPPTGWDGADPFRCELQRAGLGTQVPHPEADPYCVEFDKRHQNVTQLGVVDFLSKEPARVGAAVDKCFYFQSDHWRASVVQDDGSTKLYEWDGHYFFDKASGDGGAWVTNFDVNGHTGDPSQVPGMPPEWAQYLGPGTGGVITHDAVQADPSCAARASHGGVYAQPAPAPAGEPPLAPCADAAGAVTRRSIGPLALGMTRARARAALGAPRADGARAMRWCVDGGGVLRAAMHRGRVTGLRTTSRAHRLHGIGPGSRVRWRSGRHQVGRGVVVGVRAHRVRWLAL
jgi:hypothetical protein